MSRLGELCYTKSKDKLQCRIHIAKEHPSISKADRSEFTNFINEFNKGIEISKNLNKKNENKLPSQTNEKKLSEEYDTQCEICKQFCKGKKGLAIHTAKKHKTEQRKKIVSSYTKKTNKNEDITSCAVDDIQIAPINSERSEFQNFCSKIENDFNDILMVENKETEKCEHLVSEVVTKLKEIQDKLPGPKNPMTKFYNIRKSKNFQNVDRNYKQSSNPQRQSKRDREKREQKYNRDWIQWLYQRKRAVREISEDKNNNSSRNITYKI